MVAEGIHGVLPLPARAAVVFEAVEVTAEVRPNNSVTNTAQ